METETLCLLDKNKQHIMVRKREMTQNLNFFLVLTYLSLWSAPKEMGFVNFRLLTSSCLVFNCLYPWCLAHDCQKTWVVPSLPSDVSGQKNRLPPIPHMRTKNFQVVFKYQEWYLNGMVLYLFIYSISNFYEPFNYVFLC